MVIPDKSKSLNEGAIIAMEWNNARYEGTYYWQQLAALAKAYDIDLDLPITQLPKEKTNLVLYGTGGKSLNMVMTGRNERKSTYRAPFEGVIPNLERRYNETSSEFIRTKIGEYMTEIGPGRGKRLEPESLVVTIGDKKYYRYH